MMEGEPAKKGPLSLPSDCTYVKRKWLVCRAMEERLGGLEVPGYTEL
jgi:hypothetical protein